MKLILLFFVMDFVTILAYPIVFAYGRLRQFSKARIVSITGPVTPGS
jgi:hypothetical protein